MSEIVVSRQVFFIGAWRTPNVTDKLQQQICSQMLEKEGYSTLLNLTTDGLYLNINDVNGQTTKTDRIPLELIADFIDNKYNNTCILAKVKDNRDHYTVFVFLCRSEDDSKAMVQQFQQLKKRLSGEGYNLDMKQSGLNWTLKNKGPDDDIIHHQQNGDYRVITRTTTTSKSNGIPDSVSSASVNSDVKDEISDLAKEVRDIKLMMQKSGGRHHFAKHYGYLSSPSATQTVVNRQQFFTEEKIQPPEPVTQHVQVVKRQYIKREPESNITLVRSHGAKYKQRPSTSGHFMRTSSQSSIASTVRKRVYPSPSPFATQRYAVPQHQKRADTLRYIAASQKPAIRREYSSGSSSDIVVKNIENVYKSKRVPRRVIQVGPMVAAPSETYDYVQSHQHAAVDEDVNIEPVRSIYDNEAVNDETHKSVTRVRYVTDVNNQMYENTAYNQHQQGQDVVNASTIVNVSSNTLDEDSRHLENNETYTYREEHQSDGRSDGAYRNGNVIMVQGGGDVVRDTTTTTEGGEANVIYIKSDHTTPTYNQPQEVVGGGVYHVRASGLDDIHTNNNYEIPDDREVIIIDRKDYDDSQQATSSSNVTVIATDNHGDDGLWGAYAKQPDPSEVKDELQAETAYRYKDNDADDAVYEANGETIVTQEVTAVHATTEKRVRYLDEQLEQTIEDKTVDGEDIEQHFDDVIGHTGEQTIGNGVDEVKNTVDKTGDDLNNNLGYLNDPLLRDTHYNNEDIEVNKGSVVGELQKKFTSEAETTVLF